MGVDRITEVLTISFLLSHSFDAFDGLSEIVGCFIG